MASPSSAWRSEEGHGLCKSKSTLDGKKWVNEIGDETVIKGSEEKSEGGHPLTHAVRISIRSTRSLRRNSETTVICLLTSLQ